MSDNTDSDEISLKELVLKVQEWWRFLLSKWKIIFIGGLISGAIGLGFSLYTKAIYVAELKFVLQDEKPGGSAGMGALGLASQFGLNVGGTGGEFSADNLLLLMKSRSIIEKALLTPVYINNKQQPIVEYYIDFNRLRDNWINKPEANINFLSNDRSKYTLKQDSLLGKFYANLIANNIVIDKADKKSSLISLKVTSTNEFFAKQFSEILIKVLSDYYIQSKTEKASKNVRILQHQVDSIRNSLNNAISGVASSLDAAPNANPSLLRLRVPSQRKQVDVQANTTILGELVKNLEMAKMSLLQATPLIQVIDRPIYPLEKRELGKVKGIAVGSFVGVLLTTFFLLIKNLVKKIMD